MGALLLKGGRVIDPANNFDRKADVLISNGKIKSVGNLRVPRSVKVIDVHNKIVCPGLIDMHVHGRIPGQEKKENLGSLSLAAIMGGFTSVVCMANTNPVVDNIETLQYVQAAAEDVLHMINIYQVSAITKGLAGEEFVDLDRMGQRGAIAASDDGKGIQNPRALITAMDIGEICLPILLHCEDTRFSPDDKRSEYSYIAMVLKIAEEFGLTVHIQHVSCAESVQLIREAKESKIKVTCETAPHYFSLTQKDFKKIGPNAKMNPPLRTEKDRQAITRGLADGTIDCIATDHAPHTYKEKGLTKKGTKRKNFPINKVLPGVIGLETAVPVTLTTLWTNKRIDMMEIIRKMTANPAKILKLKGKGTLHPGSDADITVIDPYLRKKVNVKEFLSLSRNCPWDGKRLQGRPWMTIVGGHIRMKEGVLNL